MKDTRDATDVEKLTSASDGQWQYSQMSTCTQCCFEEAWPQGRRSPRGPKEARRQ
jgi:hypothetical protein